MEYFSFILLFISLYAPQCESQLIYYVTPSSSSSLANPDCHLQLPCHPLNYYAQNPSLLSNKQNVSLVFLGGLHRINTSFEISRTEHVQLSAVSGLFRAVISVWQSSDFALWFNRIGHLTVTNLTFQGIFFLKKGEIWPKVFVSFSGHFVKLAHLAMEGFEIFFKSRSNSVTYSTIINSSIAMCSERSPNIGSVLTLYKSEMLDTRIGRSSTGCKDLTLTLNGCTMTRLSGTKVEHNRITFDFGSATSLNVRIIDTTIEGYLKVISNDDSSNVNVLIVGSEIKSAIDSCLVFRLAYEAMSNYIYVLIKDTNVTDAREYGLSFEADITFRNSIEVVLENTVMKNNVNFGAVKLSSNHPYSSHDSEEELSSESKTTMNIKIVNCMFTKNKVAIIVELESNVKLILGMLVSGTTFTENENAIDFRSKAFHILSTDSTSARELTISLNNSILLNNHPKDEGRGVIRLVYVDMLSIYNCQLINNEGTAIESYYSTMTLFGENLFSNNTSIKGGALVLYESYLYFTQYSRTLFTNNQATDIGGAIYVNQLPYFRKDHLDHPPCFYQALSSKDSRDVYVGFKENSAINGGHDIYGGTLHGRCRALVNSAKLYRSSFHFQNKSLSSVTSDPLRVCLCDSLGVPQCAVKGYIYRDLTAYYPGEVFTIPAVVVGTDFGSVPGIVHPKLTWKVQNNVEMYLQVQEIKVIEECGLLTFSIQSKTVNTNYELQLFVKENNGEQKESLDLGSILEIYSRLEIIKDSLLSQNVYINFTLLDCPTGFKLTTAPPYICRCHPELVENGITVCILIDHHALIYRSGTIWISDSFSGKNNNTFVVHKNCPYHYCKPENISVDLQIPDTQCAFNHSGVLCGGCYGNLSLALGSSQCLPCSNQYLSLLTVFVFAGAVLVIFIKILDITVAQGTINGLIFYANIVWANNAILFPATDTLPPVQHILYTFIAWLNLDLGIETCFFDGLNAYWKTWLQFVFPLYVWCITLVVIVASHYSTRASKIFGNNSVPVLATLILLSYTKLLRTIIVSLGFSLLNYPDGTRIVWSFDGNVLYFSAGHAILFIAALTVLLLLWLPYTLVLFTLQWLRRKSYIKPLRWINRWKPFFDAYFGKLKPKCYYWIGLLLLLRVFLLVLNAATSTVVPRINVLALALVGLFLCVFMLIAHTGFVYTSIPLSLLEGSFILNITLLGIAKLYLPPTDSAHDSVIFASVGIAFVEFLMIAIYHTWNRAKSTYTTYKRRHRQTDDVQSNAEKELKVMTAAPENRSKMYREPLLAAS